MLHFSYRSCTVNGVKYYVGNSVYLPPDCYKFPEKEALVLDEKDFEVSTVLYFSRYFSIVWLQKTFDYHVLQCNCNYGINCKAMSVQYIIIQSNSDNKYPLGSKNWYLVSKVLPIS